MDSVVEVVINETDDHWNQRIGTGRFIGDNPEYQLPPERLTHIG